MYVVRFGRPWFNSMPSGPVGAVIGNLPLVRAAESGYSFIPEATEPTKTPR